MHIGFSVGLCGDPAWEPGARRRRRRWIESRAYNVSSSTSIIILARPVLVDLGILLAHLTTTTEGILNQAIEYGGSKPSNSSLGENCQKIALN